MTTSLAQVWRKFGAALDAPWPSLRHTLALKGQGVWRSIARWATKGGVLSWEFGAGLAQVWRIRYCGPTSLQSRLSGRPSPDTRRRTSICWTPSHD